MRQHKAVWDGAGEIHILGRTVGLMEVQSHTQGGIAAWAAMTAVEKADTHLAVAYVIQVPEDKVAAVVN